MTLRLRVLKSAWESHITTVVQEFGSVVPVVKGNGYGFGRHQLMPFATPISESNGDNIVAVGTVFETDVLPAELIAMVLTPHIGELPIIVNRDAILTVGENEHVDALVTQRWTGSVVIKVASSMKRYGSDVKKLPALVEYATENGLTIVGYSIHPPLLTESENNFGEVSSLLDAIPNGSSVYLSHLSAKSFNLLREKFPQLSLFIRLGTKLWHGDKSMLHLSTDVVDTHSVKAGTVVGYRRVETSVDGTVLVVGAGSSHAVAPLVDGRSPFHFAHKRITLLERPHMHSSLLFMPSSDDAPQIGDNIDVQCPLIAVHIDELQWVMGSSF